MYYLNYPKVDEAFSMFNKLLKNYDKEKSDLKSLNKKINSSLLEVNHNLSEFFN